VGLIALAAVAILTFAAVFAASLRLPVTDDEAWFLQVIDRCRLGERLYTDVFFGAPPLSVWLALLAVRITRPQLLVLRVMTVLYFVVLLAASTWVLVAAGAPAAGVSVVWVTAVAFGAPSWGGDNHYGQLALVTTMAAAGAVAARLEGAPAVAVVLAGAAAGLAITAKHNLGAVATLALGGVVWLAPGGSLPDAALFAVGVVAVTGATLVGLTSAGTARDFFLRTFTNKVSYLATGGLGFLEGARHIYLPFLTGRGAVVARWPVRSSFVVTALVPVGVVADVWTLQSSTAGAEKDAAALGIAVAMVVAAGLYPRADQPHVQALVPAALTSLGLGWVAADPGRTASIALAVVCGPIIVLGLACALGTRWRIPFDASSVDREVPHLRGLPVVRRTGLTSGELAELRERTEGRAFVLRPDAALWYLAADLRNPTPYDYPYASTFGPAGQGETIDAIRAGDVRWVCWPTVITGRLAPVELQDFIGSQMELVGPSAAGTLFRMPAAVDD
jgi:hypothetical protein